MGGFEFVLDGVGQAADSLGTFPGYEVATWFLAGVLLWSGVSKILHPWKAALAMADFGVVRVPRRSFGLGLGATELMLGVVLAVGQASRLALLVAVFLFLVFTALIAHSLLRGDRFPCQCFGADDARLGVISLLRAFGLLLLSGVLLAADNSDALRSPGSTETYLTLISAVAILASFALAAQFSRLIAWNGETVAYLRGLGEEE